MSEETNNRASSGPLPLEIDLRPVDTKHAISASRKYLEIMEQHMPLIQQAELSALEGTRELADDGEGRSIHSSIITYAENLFEEDIIPTMRYSCIVFLHTVFETRLHDLCDTLRLEKSIPISLSDLRGSAIDQAKDYLSKLADIPVATYPEWDPLRSFQKIRDCIVHHYGFVKPNEDRFKNIMNIIKSDPNLTLNCRNRISPSIGFIKRQINYTESFLDRLMTDMGWDLH